jgi:hypothetical protein
MPSSFEHGKKSFMYHKRGGISWLASDYELLKKDSVLWNWLPSKINAVEILKFVEN